MQEVDQFYVQQHLKSIIIHSLDNFNYRNAEFACERLLANFPDNFESIYLYCLTLYRQAKFKTIYNKVADTIDVNDNLGCAYIFAKLCLALKKHKEGIYQLLKLSHLYNETAIFNSNDLAADGEFSDKQNPATFSTPHLRYNYQSNRSIYPDASSIYHLLGDLYKATGDVKNSALNYSTCLKYNQFDFEAFQELCKLGVNVKVKSVFKLNTIFNNNLKDNLNQTFDKTTEEPFIKVTNPFTATPINHGNRVMDDSIEPISTPRVKSVPVPSAPLRKTNFFGNNDKSDFPKPNFPIHSNITPTAPSTIDDTISRKGKSAYSKITSRLTKTNDSHINSEPSDTNINKRPLRMKRNSSSSIIALKNDSSNSSFIINKEIESSEDYLLKLYIVFAKAFKSMSKFDCFKAIRILENLPDHEKETPWVLSKLGRLHYEIVNYKQSEYFFIKLRTLDRTRLEDMEYYSTLLWHLHKKVELTYLANELHDLDKNLAITWCAIGNLFSLDREPDEAIKCFTKSTKLDENFTYAYTLKGHEYFGNDNYEMALENFRISLLIDSRHYNALYGIGMVFINLGDYQKADYHFRKAVAINPINIILICCVGMVLEKMGKKNLALRQYELANKLQPLSALPIFKKAQLLFSMQQFSQALQYFEQVKELAPNEASVHFLLGQLYNIQNDKFQAIREFTIALNLDPKGNYLIREAMESLKQK